MIFRIVGTTFVGIDIIQKSSSIGIKMDMQLKKKTDRAT